MKYDLIVVGMGPSAAFLAYELIELNNYKNVLLGSWFPQGPSSLGKNWQLEVHLTCCSGILFPGRIL